LAGGGYGLVGVGDLVVLAGDAGKVGWVEVVAGVAGGVVIGSREG